MKQNPERLLSSICSIQEQYHSGYPTQKLFAKILELLLDVTESEYGFIGEVLKNSDDPYLKTHAITDISWSPETRSFYQENAPQGLEFYNLDSLFGAVIRTEKLVISLDPSNDPRRTGLPPGHPDLNQFLGIPLYFKENMIGMVGLANGRDEFNEKVVEYLMPVLLTCSTLISSQGNLNDLEDTKQDFDYLRGELSKKNQKLDQYTYILSHNIRSSSANINMLLNLWEDSNTKDKEVLFEHLKKTSSDLNDTVEHLSQVLRQNAETKTHHTEVSFYEAIDRTCHPFQELIKESQAKFLLDLDQAPTYNGSAPMIESCFYELISNSLKYRSPKTPPEILIKTRTTEHGIDLTFRDNGIGIDLKRHGEKVFGLYKTFHRNLGGIGLGLFALKNQIEMAGGSVEIESQVGKGTEFRIFLPQ